MGEGWEGVSAMQFDRNLASRSQPSRRIRAAGRAPAGYALTPRGSCPPRPRGKVWSFSSTGLPSHIA